MPGIALRLRYGVRGGRRVRPAWDNWMEAYWVASRVVPYWRLRERPRTSATALRPISSMFDFQAALSDEFKRQANRCFADIYEQVLQD